MFRQFKEKNKNVLRLKLKSALKIDFISLGRGGEGGL